MKYISIDPAVRGGEPCLRRTRVPVSIILGELADGLSVCELAFDLDLPLPEVQGLLLELAKMWTRSSARL